MDKSSKTALSAGKHFLVLTTVALLVSGCALLRAPPPQTTVTLAALTSPLVDDEKSDVTATVVTDNNTVPGHRVNFSLDVDTAGALNAARVATDGQGVAATFFTAAVVDKNTTVKVTATGTNLGRSSDTKSLVVKPPIVYEDWGDTPSVDLDSADVVISTSVTELDDDEFKYEYTIEAQRFSAANPNEMFKALGNFQVEMGNFVPTGGTGASQANGTVLSATKDLGSNKFTITAECECRPGGTTRWVIQKLVAAGDPPVIVTITTTGPKVVPP